MQQGVGQRVAAGQGGPQLGLDLRAGRAFRPRPGRAARRDAAATSVLAHAAIEAVQFGGPPMQPLLRGAVAVEESRAGGEAMPRPSPAPARRWPARSGRWSRRPCPIRVRAIGHSRRPTAAGPGRQTRGCGRVARHQLADHGQHRLLHARIERVVVGGQAAAGGVGLRARGRRPGRSTRCPAPRSRRGGAAPPTAAAGMANSSEGISCSPSRSNSRKSISSTSLRSGSWAVAANTPRVVARRGLQRARWDRSRCRRPATDIIRPL